MTPSSSAVVMMSSRPVVAATHGVLRVTAGGEGVRGRVVHDVDGGHRRARRDREVLDDTAEPRIVGLLDLHGAARHDGLPLAKKYWNSGVCDRHRDQ